MNIGKKLKLLIAAVATTAIMGQVNAKAASGDLELMYGANNSGNVMITTAKASGNITNKIGYFGKVVETVNSANDYETSTFALADLTLSLAKGLDLIGDSQFTSGIKPDLRLGMQFFKTWGDFNTYFSTTRNFTANPNTEMALIIGYNRKLNEHFGLNGSIDACLNLSDTGYNFDSTKVRAGLNYKGFNFGPALNMTGIGSNEEQDYTLGGFIGVKF